MIDQLSRYRGTVIDKEGVRASLACLGGAVQLVTLVTLEEHLNSDGSETYYAKAMTAWLY